MDFPFLFEKKKEKKKEAQLPLQIELPLIDNRQIKKNNIKNEDEEKKNIIIQIT